MGPLGGYIFWARNGTFHNIVGAKVMADGFRIR